MCHGLKCATEMNYNKIWHTEVFTQNYIFTCIAMNALSEHTSKSSQYKCFLISVCKSLQRDPACNAKVTVVISFNCDNRY